MTRAVDVGPIRLVTIEAEKRRVCQACGAAKETRPYGPGGIRVCFACMKKHEGEAVKQFTKFLEGNHD